MIDIDELVRLWICDKLGDTWVWVAPGLEKEQVVAVGVAQVEQEIYEEGVQAEPAPVHVPLAAAPTPGTMPQRMARLEDEIHGLHESLREQRVVLDEMS
ncbi:hypothetical protein Tco_1444331 [Tanacetum coccineum]